MKGCSPEDVFELEDLRCVYDTILMSGNSDVVDWFIPNFATQIILSQSFFVTPDIVCILVSEID